MKDLLQASESVEDAREDDMESINVSKSPEKPINKFELYNADVKCTIVDFDFLENPFIIPFLFNCQSDNEHLISTAVPTEIQQNANFVSEISALAKQIRFAC